MTDDRSLPLDHEPLNRAERRAQRFHPKSGQPDPHAVAAPGAGDEAAPTDAEQDSIARSGSGDVTHLTGAGTGGAMESDDRMPHHEGAHYGNQPNS
jgi:hypothetical protein